ncbi:hypothetical protein Hanom_Chr14g01266921 [Helianthus anomalus]
MHVTQDTMRATQETMWATQDTMREEMYAGFSYIFRGLQSIYPSHFGEPPQFSFGNRGNYGAGSSGTCHHDDDDDEEEEEEVERTIQKTGHVTCLADL